MTRIKEVTITTKVTDILRTKDDFVNLDELAKLTGETRKVIQMTMWYLRKIRVADCIVEKDGVSWWFALPEAEDQRMRVLSERYPETAKRRRKIRPKPIT